MILLFSTELLDATACLYSRAVGLTIFLLVEIEELLVLRLPTTGQDASRATSLVKKGMT